MSSSSSPSIVDFPSLPRQATSNKEKKGVRFAGFSEMFVFEVHPVIRSKLWYSSEDTSQLLRQQILESRMALTEVQDDTITEDTISFCAGLEKALSPTHARLSVQG